MTRNEYQAYLRSDEWKRLRTRVRRRARGRCERCHVNQRTDVHHLTYERVGREELSDLIGVCGDCHNALHGRSQYDPRTCAEHLTDDEKKVLFGMHQSWSDCYIKTGARSMGACEYWTDRQRSVLDKWKRAGGI